MIKLFGVYVAKSIVLLGIIEFIVFFVAFYGAVLIHYDLEYQHQLISSDSITSTASLFALVMFSSVLSLGLYQPGSMIQASGFLVRLFLVFVLGTAVTGILFFILQDLFLT
ncbi:MAG: hypothetical protein PVG22_09665, partial [Chromatiales bacterium]